MSILEPVDDTLEPDDFKPNLELNKDIITTQPSLKVKIEGKELKTKKIINLGIRSLPIESKA